METIDFNEVIRDNIEVVGGLLPIFNTTNDVGFQNLKNGGEYHLSYAATGKKIFHLLSFNTLTGFKAFELTAYCNYTTVKCVCLMYGEDNASIRVNLLGKDGTQKLSLKRIGGDIYIEVDTITNMFEVRLKPLFSIASTHIRMQNASGIDLSSATLLADL